MHKYTTKQIEHLRKIARGKNNKKITEMFNEKFNLNISEKAIEGTRKRYEIKNGLDGTFKKGHKPWNKGLKGLNFGGKETQFKKGSFSSNRVPLGSERITKDGYIQIKVQDGTLQKNWKGKHIIEWEKANGEVPEGHAVIFGDGDSRNFDIDNLILVTREELLTLNRKGLIKNDAELTRTGLNIAKLIKKIRDRKSC